ncbi:WD40-repeat-containing domain protein [Trichophaea hybrida]|nr:WD40-repeat-containing domain protein [Trichophaea hybrida]
MDNHRIYNHSVSNELNTPTIVGDVNFHMGSQDEHDRFLSKLPYASEAAFNSRFWEHDPLCLPNTRVELLEQIMTWSRNPDGSCIFWLNGMAGTGKTTIARTVARACADLNILGASFFFSIGQDDLNHASKFFTTIAVQLAINVPALQPDIGIAIRENFNISHQSLAEQWNKLIMRPLSNLRGCSDLLILVIDALDECFNSIPQAARSRQDFILHNISQTIIQQDLMIFFGNQFENIRRRKCWLPDDWPGQGDVALLVRRADKLFIYAATICRFLQYSINPMQHLSDVLQGCTAVWSPTGELDAMYTRILKHSITGELEKELSELFRPVVGSIILLFDPLSAGSLAKLLRKNECEVQETLDSLRSVLDVSESQDCSIRLLHPSFRDFLLDPQRCSERQFRIDKNQTHGDLFASCITLMSKHLKKDMCNLRVPGALSSEVEDSVVKKSLPPDVQYACRYWVYHLNLSDVEVCDNDQVHSFLRTHFLHWLEALSLIGKALESVLMVKSLESTPTLKPNTSHALRSMIYDAKCFVLNYISILETAPLQIYCSALVFSPLGSVIKSQFRDQVPLWIKNIPAVQHDWSPTLQPLEGHSRVVNSVAFSPDGQLLASASEYCGVRFWDPSTGGVLGTIEGHSNYIRGVAFSPNGQLLACTYGRTIWLWDPTTLTAGGTLEGHSDAVQGVAFSPDGQLLASASSDSTIRLWDPTKRTVKSILKVHSSVMGVAFAPHSQLLASASLDHTIRLWNPSTGDAISTLKGHFEGVLKVGFSPNGQLLASASQDRTVRLWDLSTETALGVLEGHSNVVSGVAFSPDGKLLASASYDHTVRLWDPTTGTTRGIFKGHSGAVMGVAFAPNGQLLASASHDRTVRLWDLSISAYDHTVRLWDSSIGAAHGAVQGNSSVSAVAFPTDSKLVASVSINGTVRFWDPSTGAAHVTHEGHSSNIEAVAVAVAVSPDGQLLATAFHDRTVKLWDLSTGAARGALEGHSAAIMEVAFSPNSQLLASSSYDHTVRLWDSSTATARSTLRGHSYKVNGVAFSPDGQLLGSAAWDRTVKLWDPSTGEARGTLEGHSYMVKAVAFSPNSQLLASTSNDCTVRLWDPLTATARGTLNGHSSLANRVAFSLDGQLLASAAWDKTVRLWNINTKETIEVFYAEEPIRELSFPSFGSYLQTNQGILQIKRFTQCESRSHSNSTPCPLRVEGHWVKWGAENILRLPPDYQATCVSVRKNVLAIGHAFGRVTFVEFDPDTIRLVLS